VTRPASKVEALTLLARRIIVPLLGAPLFGDDSKMREDRGLKNPYLLYSLLRKVHEWRRTVQPNRKSVLQRRG
jgi:hypothetical protein